jgi:hypothetical protein
MRGDTLQWLLITEFGKICAKYPEKAREIITGALNTVHVGQRVTIESTAEGQEGRFYEMTTTAENMALEAGRCRSSTSSSTSIRGGVDRKNRLDPAHVPMPEPMERYFAGPGEGEPAHPARRPRSAPGTSRRPRRRAPT